MKKKKKNDYWSAIDMQEYANIKSLDWWIFIPI